jgi:hypothetical protein
MSPESFLTWLTQQFVTLWLMSLLWVLAVVSASIVFRRSRRKPVLFFSVPNAVFQERTASGCSNDRWWRRLGGANNCLVVAITPARLVIRPFFPFNLMFLPETYGLEYDVPLGSVVRVIVDRSLFRRRVRVWFRDGDRECDVSLFLKQPEEFLRLVSPGGSS